MTEENGKNNEEGKNNAGEGTPKPPEVKPPAGNTAGEQGKQPGEEGKNNVQPSALETAQELLKGLTEQNDRTEQLQKTAKDIQANELLGGRIPAGKEVDTDKERIEKGARALLEGTGYEDELFPQK